MKNIITFLLLTFCCSIFGQNRIPKNGETIVFYPLNKGNEIAKEEYDCFYSFSQVAAKGKYDFKAKFRFKKNTSNVTPSSEIEGYNFFVEKQETILEKGKPFLLLFLKRNGDEEKIILRVPCFFDEKSNAITQSFTKFKTEYDNFYNKKYYSYIVLPYINSDSLCLIKEQYAKKDIVYGLRGYDIFNKDKHKEKFNLKELSRAINVGFYEYEYDVPYSGMDLDFINISESLIYKQLCILAKSPNGKKINIPVTFLVGNTDFYYKSKDGVYIFLNDFFYTKEEFLQKEFKRNKCENIVLKYTGQKVYYGLDNMYEYKSEHSKKFNALENRVLSTNQLYTLKKGVYECVRFDVLKRFDKDYSIMEEPFAILRDSLGVEFRVPVCETSFTRYSYPEIRTGKFEEYFVLAELVDGILRERAEIKLQKELAEKEKIRRLTQKYGKSYADFLISWGDATIERFETLSKKYGKANAKLIIERRVKLGWSEEMCRESWGSPSDINTTTGSWGVHEQWVYEVSYEDYYNMRCLYFENGVLTTIQD